VLDRREQVGVVLEVSVGSRGGDPDAAGGLAEHNGFGAALPGEFGRGGGQRVAQIAVVVATAWGSPLRGRPFVPHPTMLPHVDTVSIHGARMFTP
jgi:alkylation response protein AidB-like acyl-CoA dehydrogenase